MTATILLCCAESGHKYQQPVDMTNEFQSTPIGLSTTTETGAEPSMTYADLLEYDRNITENGYYLRYSGIELNRYFKY